MTILGPLGGGGDMQGKYLNKGSLDPFGIQLKQFPVLYSNVCVHTHWLVHLSAHRNWSVGLGEKQKYVFNSVNVDRGLKRGQPLKGLDLHPCQGQSPRPSCCSQA